GPTRSESHTEQLVLGQDTQIAHIQIQLEPRDDYPRFRAEVRGGGKEVVSFGALARHGSGDSQTVSMDIPASSLPSGSYEVALKGRRDGQSPQEIGYYYLRVQKQ